MHNKRPGHRGKDARYEHAFIDPYRHPRHEDTRTMGREYFGIRIFWKIQKIRNYLRGDVIPAENSPSAKRANMPRCSIGSMAVISRFRVIS